MRLKTKLVLAISAMVVALVATLSLIYLSQLLHLRINAEYEHDEEFADLMLHSAQDALEQDFSSTRIDTSNPDQLRDAIAESLQTDAGVNSLLEGITSYPPTVIDAAICDLQGRALLHSNPALISKVAEPRADFDTVRKGSVWQQLKVVYGTSKIYDIRVPLARQGGPFGSVRVGISTTLLKNELKPPLDRALMFSGIAILVSLVLAAALSNFALRPLVTISRQLDAMALSGPLPEPAVPPPPRARDEVGVVANKIDRLGRQMRDAKEVFSALKENLDQIMSTLQDGLVLFTRDLRVVLVSASAERFLARPRGEILGHQADEFLTAESRLGGLLLNALHGRQSVDLREIEESGRRVQVSVDFIEERGEQMGALVTMHDAESVRRIENEIELSRRLAAIGQLTRGVAHEVKNPINAIVVHLEIMRQKLQQADPDTRRHMDVIGSEIQRLDRVVQMLVDFTRPVELRLADADLRRVVDEVAMLASPDAERHGVHMERRLGAEPLPVRIDSDLVKQAVLNVVLNGVQAMPQGGTLTIAAARTEQGIELSVHDQGAGIPPEIREKIFDLYFTTKKAGSGIGLAMTFRVMQLHHGAVEFESNQGDGTTFILRFPPLESQRSPMEELAART